MPLVRQTKSIMAKRQLSFNPAPIWSANFSTVLSISLVLFMLGFMLLFIFHAFTASNNIKEEVNFTVYLVEGSTPQEATELIKDLKLNKNVKDAKYVSADDAKKEMDKVMGTDHLDVLDSENPYSASIVVTLKAQSLNNTNIKPFVQSVEAKSIVDNVDYRQDLVQNINTTIYNVSGFVLALVICLLIIAVTLINHTIRLSIYSKRFLIRSMELVGAKRKLIQKPFMIKGLWFGIIGAVVADVLLLLLLVWVANTFSGIVMPKYYLIYGILGGGILVFGVLLSFTCTVISVYKFMHISRERLYR